MKMNESDTKTHTFSLALGLTAALSATACVACDVRDFLPIPKVAFVQPKNDALVTSPVYFELEAKNWVIEEAGERRDGAGYFVISLVNGCVEEGRLVPLSEDYLHLRDGSYTAWAYMLPGNHHVCLQVADGNGRAIPLIDEIDFEVVGE